MMEALGSSETSLFTRATRRNIQEYGILNDFVSLTPLKYLDLTPTIAFQILSDSSLM
jgi:hypothetical protein